MDMRGADGSPSLMTLRTAKMRYGMAGKFAKMVMAICTLYGGMTYSKIRD